MPQYFKREGADPKELLYYNSGAPLMDSRSLEKDEMFEDAFNCFLLGDVLYDLNRAPLARAIPQEIFRESFSVVFEAFISAGTFESYLTVFRKIFGDLVDVTFTVPNPGHLQIDIIAEGVEESGFLARMIENNAYVYNQIIDDEGDRIVFQTIKGFQSQYELEQMLFEMVPNGIFTEITLSFG